MVYRKPSGPSWFMTTAVAGDFVNILEIDPENVQEIKREAQERAMQCPESCGRYDQCISDFAAMLAMAKKETLDDADRKLLADFHEETGCCNEEEGRSWKGCRVMQAQPRGATIVANYYDPARQDGSPVQEAMSA